MAYIIIQLVRPAHYGAYTLLLLLIVNSSYLSYKYFNFYYAGNLLDNLNCTDDCDSVMMSQYAMIGSIPVPFFGLAYFIALTLAFILFQASKLAQKWMDLLVLIGLLSATGFLYLLYFELHMVCKFCLFSHICTGLFTINYFASLRK